LNTLSIPAIPTRTTLGLIVLLAIVLRSVFFVGLVSGDPQDDGVYYNNAFALFNQGPTYLGQYRHLPAGFLANPIDQFNVRPMVTYPVAASFALFGPGELPATMWSFLWSTLSVLVVYRLGLTLHGQAVGLLAALLCAFYPLEVINGTRILSDVPLGFFTSVGLLLLVEGWKQARPVFFAWSGVAAGLAYLANARALVSLIALAGGAVALAARRKADLRAPVFLLGGFMAIFCIEALAYSAATGDPFLSYHIQSGASLFKYLHEPVTSLHLGPLQVRYTNGEPLYLVRSVFLMDDGPTRPFGFMFFLFLPSVLLSLVRRRNLLLTATAVGLFVYLEFAPVRVSIDQAHREVEYMMLFKQQRFLLALTAPLVVLAADLLHGIARGFRITAVALILALFVTSILAIVRTRRYYRAGLADMRAATDYVVSHPERAFYGDLWAVEHVKIFSRYRAQSLRVLDSRTRPEDLAHACVMLGGSRGVELLSDYVESTLPSFARDVFESGVPIGWQVMQEIRGEGSPLRRHNLTIYCVP